jgi:DNA recombination protein RmuC
MDTLYFALFGFLLIFIVVCFFFYKLMVQFKHEISESSLNAQSNHNESLLNFQQKVQRDQFELQGVFQERLEKSFESLNSKVNARLNTDFEQNQNALKNLGERLVRIDEAQKSLDSLGKNVESLQAILSDKKTRGIFGEVQLAQILENIFGSSGRIFKLQFSLPNKTIVDCALMLPQPMGILAVDAKFPLENYKKYQEQKDKKARLEAQRDFKRDMKKHIDDIASKYIIAGVTSDQAMMFIPSEVIFSDIFAHFEDLVHYSYSKKVWMTSPTTLMAVMTTIQTTVKNKERLEYAHVIQSELAKLGKDFMIFQERWKKMGRHLETTVKNIGELNTNSEKISKRFETIVDVKFTLDNKEGEGSDFTPNQLS